jgi:activator of HSP90 ATPase
MEFTVSAIIPAKRRKVYKAWLNSKQHSKMTGGEAHVSNKVGDTFTAWDGYISGTNLILERKKRIIQFWRTTEFDENEENSQVEILFERDPKGTKISLIHTNLPANGEQYKQGWFDYYFNPMTEYFK